MQPEQIGVRGFHPELRHTAAGLAMASGADVMVVQQMLGHKSATMTLDLYAHRLDVVADAMDLALPRSRMCTRCVPVGGGANGCLSKVPLTRGEKW